MTFDEFEREILEARPRGGSRVNLVLLNRVDSTNRLARRVAGEYLKESMWPPPVLLLAREQTGGRGRAGRPWVSPPGLGIYATLLLGIGDAESVQTLPLLVAVGLARALGGYVPCDIKWPNDLVVAGRKIGGILIEALSGDRGASGADAAPPGRESLAVVGFGVNHGQRRADLPVETATSLALETASAPPLGRLAWELIGAVHRELEHLGQVEYAAASYRELAVHRRGDPLRCRVGEEIIEGIFQGFDPRGFLILSVDGEERRVAAGEVIER